MELKTQAEEIIQKLRATCLPVFQGMAQAKKLGSGIPALDRFFAGGLPFGRLIELGIPLDKGGRFCLIPFMSQAIRENHWCLWAYSQTEIKAFAPAFLSRGAQSERMLFAQSVTPIQDLKQLLLHPLVQVVVFDSPPRLQRDDLSFLSVQARQQGKLFLLIRPYFLSNKLGNIWAHWRVNIWFRPKSDQFVVRPVRGLGTVDLTLEAACLTG